MKYLTPGKIACLGVVLFVIGNEVTEGAIRNTLEIIAGVLAVIGLVLE
jgi:hypothetical protein